MEEEYFESYYAPFLYWNSQEKVGKTPLEALPQKTDCYYHGAVKLSVEVLGYNLHCCASTEILKSLWWQK